MSENIERLENGKFRIRVSQPDKVQEVSEQELEGKKRFLVDQISKLQTRIDFFTTELASIESILTSLSSLTSEEEANIPEVEEGTIVEK